MGMGKNLGIFTGLATALILLLTINLVSSAMLRNIKVDMTEEKLFTLSDGTKKLLDNIEDKITIKLFYSKKAANAVPSLGQYADRVVELLRQYKDASGGALILEQVDPRPDTETEEAAVKYGLTPYQIMGQEPIYLGLVVVNEVGAQESVSRLDLQRESFLEYDISRLIASVSNSHKKKIGVMSAMSVLGGPSNDPMAQFRGQPPSDPWAFTIDLRRQYDVEKVEMDADSIDPSIDLLLVIHPKGITDGAQYAIDQYILRGGHVIAMVDPLSMYEQTTFQSPDPNARFQASFDSALPRLFEAWGLDMDRSKVLADLNLATTLGAGQGRAPKPYPNVLSIGLENCNQNEIVSSNMESLMVFDAGALKKTDDAKYEMTPLIQSTDEASEIDGFILKFGGGDPDQMRRDFKPGTEKLAIAYKITGRFETAFPGGKPASADADAGKDKQEDKEDDGEHIAQAENENTVIVIADVDMIADGFAVQRQRLLGQSFVMMLNDNLNFLNNAIEVMSSSQELIGLRTRGRSRRPFTTVDRLEREAQDRYQEEESRLQAKVTEVNGKLQELQRGKQDNNRAVITQAQQQEMDRFRADLADTKKKLRGVRRNLRQDIERLGTRIKIINIGFFPMLVLLGCFFPMAWRSYKVRGSQPPAGMSASKTDESSDE